MNSVCVQINDTCLVNIRSMPCDEVIIQYTVCYFTSSGMSSLISSMSPWNPII
jgi:hypothetical protein